MNSRALTKTQIKFGTDGWRAIIGEQFTHEAVARLSQAYAAHLLEVTSADRAAQAPPLPDAGAAPLRNADAPPVVTVGFDNRFQSDLFAATVARVLRANGITTYLFPQPVPTPLVSFAVVHGKQSGGIVITASHNPPEYNGFKIKDSWGGSAFESTTQAVEALLDTQQVREVDDRAPIPAPAEDVRSAYLRQLSSLIDINCIRSASLNVVVDSMHGTGGRILEELLDGGKTAVSTIRAERDCLFGGVSPEPIEKHLQALKDAVVESAATIGIATDGDADRLGAVNEFGQNMTMHQIVPLLLMHLVKNKRMNGSVVVTVTQSVVMKRMAEALKLPYVETPVGFKYIASHMLDSDVLIGAEESGGIGIKGHIMERDGLFNGLLLLEAIATFGTTPTKLVEQIQKEFGYFYYDRVDLHVLMDDSKRFLEQITKTPPAQLASTKVTDVVTTDGVKLVLADDSWLMFRRSGTEPVLRVYSEATSKQKVQDLLSEAQIMLGGI